MDKFLKINNDKLTFILYFYPKEFRPILWNHKGFYGWIPMEVVKNETENAKIKKDTTVTFTWQQAYPLRQDVGKILENLNNNNSQTNNSPQSNSPS